MLQKFGVFLVEQPPCSMSNEAGARPGEIDADNHRDERVEPLPPRESDQSEPNDDAKARPKVAQDVLAVCDQCQRAVPLPGPDEVQAKQCVCCPGTEGDQHSCVEGVDLDPPNEGALPRCRG